MLYRTMQKSCKNAMSYLQKVKHQKLFLQPSIIPLIEIMECFKQSWSVHKRIHDASPFSNSWPHFQYTGDLRPYPTNVKRDVPKHIKRPDYADHPEGRSMAEEKSKESMTIVVLTPEEIVKSRTACQLARRVMDEVAKAIKIGITTDHIDQIVYEEAIKRNCYPSPLNYYGFPKSCCTSVNEVICHGIPDGYTLKDGDIVNVDITLYHDGFHGDLNETFFVGNVDEKYKKLTSVTYECLTKAIGMVRPGVYYRELGNTIQKHANANGFSVVKSYTGHGCHKLFHCPPNVPHYAKNKAVGVMKAGHVFTIEPMINEGNQYSEVCNRCALLGSFSDTCWPDDWTVVTVDGKRSAQFEQTLLVTDTGCEILTRRMARKGQPYFMDSVTQ